MGAITPIVLTGASLGLDLLENASQTRDAERRAAQSSTAARAEADLRLAKLQADQAEETAERQSALRRTQARTRALLASRGIGGSGGAVLQGLAAEAAREEAVAATDADLRRRSIQLGVDTVQQRNLLAVGEARRRAQFDLLRSGLSGASSVGSRLA
ncbi:MAG TPA: hypothetical protein VKA18_07065 [Alphaproteobacteria bacterium]|nr:hypothetical protein [Alphaproteobacteria bacterium]